MKLFRKEQRPKIQYDPETQEPAVRSSICTGEMTVGFIDRKTDKFRDYELARNQSDVEKFCSNVGITTEQLKKIY